MSEKMVEAFTGAIFLQRGYTFLLGRQRVQVDQLDAFKTNLFPVCPSSKVLPSVVSQINLKVLCSLMHIDFSFCLFVFFRTLKFIKTLLTFLASLITAF